jgi:hypothetical protein
MLVKKLIQTRNADADLPPEVRAGLVESLFGPITSLIAGALGCAVIGAGVALRAADGRILIVSAALLATGLLRVASALLYKSKRATGDISATRLWERIYEFGAWVFAALLGLLCWMTLTHSHLGPQRGASFHRDRPAHAHFFAARDLADALSRMAAQGARLRRAAVHLRHDGHHPRHP